MSADDTAAIEININQHLRNGVEVLKQINLSTNVKRLGLVGRNGSGKSSLARLLVGLESPSDGSISIFGGDVSSDRNFALNTVGMIFQNPVHQIIFPSVREEIEFGLNNLGYEQGIVSDKTRAILEKFSVSHLIDKPVHMLSHGQQHLVCLMAVLAMEPRLIILDEPYTGLDIPTVIQMRGLLNDLEQNIVLITHNPDELDSFDEIIWLDSGRIEAYGASQEILHQFRMVMNNMGSKC